MSWAWCLPCGFQSPLPYFYVIYFGILLFHRQTRDDEACALKCVAPPPSPRRALGRARALLGCGRRHEQRLTQLWVHSRRYKKDWETYKKLVPYRCVEPVLRIRPQLVELHRLVGPPLLPRSVADAAPLPRQHHPLRVLDVAVAKSLSGREMLETEMRSERLGSSERDREGAVLRDCERYPVSAELLGKRSSSNARRCEAAAGGDAAVLLVASPPSLPPLPLPLPSHPLGSPEQGRRTLVHLDSTLLSRPPASPPSLSANRPGSSTLPTSPFCPPSRLPRLSAALWLPGSHLGLPWLALVGGAGARERSGRFSSASPPVPSELTQPLEPRASALLDCRALAETLQQTSEPGDES